MRKAQLTLILLILAAAFLCAGCASTPKARLRAALDTYAVSVNALTDLGEAGLIKPDAARRIELARLVASKTLDSIDADIAAGKTPAQAEWNALSVALLALADEQKR